MATAGWHLILNGKQAADDDLRAAVTAQRERGTEIAVRVTWEAGDAARFVDEALAAGAGRVIAAGGDGTLHEICSTLAATDLDAEALPSVGILPLGTANDFATAAGIPDALAEAFEVLVRAPARAIDLMRVLPAGGPARWCVNVATAGFATQITTDTPPELKRMLGGTAYLLTGLTRVGSMQAANGRLHGPGFDWHGEFLVLAIGNGRQAGGGHALTPAARLDDGAIDVTILPPPPEGEIGSAFGALFRRGREALLDTAVRCVLPWVEIEAEEGLNFNLDGEPLVASRLRIEAVPARLRMHLPAATPLLAFA